MRLLFSFLYGQCIIFCWQYHFVTTHPLMGNNIRSAVEGEFLGVVSIQIVAENRTLVEQHVCTGTLISREDVITAYHCLDDLNYVNSIRISLGSINLNHNTNYYAAWWISYAAWATYRQYELTYTQNDIAIIRLTERAPLGFSPAITSFCSNEYLTNVKTTLAGWGKSNNFTTSPIMKTVEVTIISKDECNARMTRLRGSPTNLEEIFLCTVADPYAILGRGDSGGPLFYEDDIVAINKAIGPTLDYVTQDQKINVHINISFYRHFITHIKYYS